MERIYKGSGDAYAIISPTMTQRETPPPEELSRLALVLARRFVNRWDLYPRQLADGSYISVHEPLRASLLVKHLAGEETLGTYLLNRQSQARFVVLDADDEAGWAGLKEVCASLAEEGTVSYLEQSRRGGHLWLFLAEPVAGEAVRAFGKGILSHYQLEDMELYPKQDQLKSGPGSLIRMPFGVHQLTGRRYGFHWPDGAPLASTIREQIQLLSQPQVVSKIAFEQFRALDVSSAPQRQIAPLKPQEPMGETVSERIKSSISVFDFVSRYVQLSSTGKGLCPFHDDHCYSFSVNQDENYWACFACNTGGSIIDFYMKLHDVDFSQAVKELAELLL
jgi:hypothetical protein